MSTVKVVAFAGCCEVAAGSKSALKLDLILSMITLLLEARVESLC